MENWDPTKNDFIERLSSHRNRTAIHPECTGENKRKETVILDIYNLPDEDETMLVDDLISVQLCYNRYFGFFYTYNMAFQISFPIYGKIVVPVDLEDDTLRLLNKLNSDKQKTIIKHLMAEVFSYVPKYLQRFGNEEYTKSLKTFYKQCRELRPFLEKIEDARFGEAIVEKCKLTVEFEDGTRMVFTDKDLLVNFIIKEYPEHTRTPENNTKPKVLPIHDSKYREFFRSNLIMGLHQYIKNETDIYPSKVKNGMKKTSDPGLIFIFEFIEITIPSLFDEFKDNMGNLDIERCKAIIKTTISSHPKS